MYLIILVPLVVYACVCIAFYLRQHALIYYPAPPPSSTPLARGLSFEDVWVDTPDGVRLHAWWIEGRIRTRSSVVQRTGVIHYSHGNAGNIESRLEIAAAFADMGHSVLLYDYRGYGGGSGRPNERGTYCDAESVHDHLTLARGVDSRRIIAFGESMGGAVAVELAVRRPLCALITEDTFTSIAQIGAALYPWLPVRLLSRTRYDSLSKIGSLALPILIIHSPEDHLVPIAHAHALFAAARGKKRMLQTAGDHNGGGFLLRVEWIEAVRAFIDEALDSAEGTS